LYQVILVEGFAVFAPLFFDFPDEHVSKVDNAAQKNNNRTSLQIEKPIKITPYEPYRHFDPGKFVKIGALKPSWVKGLQQPDNTIPLRNTRIGRLNFLLELNMFLG
jgi:hypothetical protein